MPALSARASQPGLACSANNPLVLSELLQACLRDERLDSRTTYPRVLVAPNPGEARMAQPLIRRLFEKLDACG